MDPAHDEALFFESPEAFEAWLDAHHDASSGIWVRMAKKHTGVQSLDWEGAVGVALCFGWIDGQRRRLDDEWFRQRFTPRRSRSSWSKVNREKVGALEAAGRMRPAGLREVERAKEDGRWDAAYDGMATATVPDDLAAALAAAGLTDVFAALPAGERYSVLHPLMIAKRPETRVRRIAAAVERLQAAAAEPPGA